jgi:hypothetical protein
MMRDTKLLHLSSFFLVARVESLKVSGRPLVVPKNLALFVDDLKH